MPKYSYTALADDGSLIKGVEEADTPAEVGLALRDRDLLLTHVKERKGVLQFEITRKRVPRRELMHFSRQLSVFLRAGVPVVDAISVIAEENTNKLFKKGLDDMAEGLKSGDSFSGAATMHPEIFPDFYLGILRSAELTGRLDAVLDQLAEYIDRDLEARRKVISALMYPAIVAVMSVVTVIVLTSWVLPKFEVFFKSLHAKLPLATRLLLHIAHFLSSWGLVIIGLVIAAAIGIALSLRTERGKLVRDTVLMRVPVLGELIRTAVLERFCRIFSAMVRSGVPMPEAMKVTAEGTSNRVYRGGLFDVRDRMLRGEGLAAPINATGIFPPAARQMIRVGEDTGTLDEQLETAAEYFDRELDYKLKRFTNLFEPAVIMFMGVVVGFVAIALVSAMYGIFRQVRV